MLTKEIIYLISIALIFYVFGIVLSNIINNIFPACNFKRKDGIITVSYTHLTLPTNREV